VIRFSLVRQAWQGTSGVRSVYQYRIVPPVAASSGALTALLLDRPKIGLNSAALA